jgi:HAD superfamily hydrolase (TIGR01509 family)
MIVSNIRGVILDVDGTLVLSNDAHAEAWMEAMADFGYYVPYEKIRPLIGMGGDKVLPETIGLQKNSEDGIKISEKRKEIFQKKHVPTLWAAPGARELVEYMHVHGLKLAVASSAEKDELKALLRVAGVSGLVEEEISSSDTGRSKPDPDVIQVALQRFDLPANQVLTLGDTPYDIEAASKVGVGTIALRCGGWSDHELKGALAIYNDPDDLLNHYDTSPLGDSWQE